MKQKIISIKLSKESFDNLKSYVNENKKKGFLKSFSYNKVVKLGLESLKKNEVKK